MRCDEFEQRLHDLLDSRRYPEADPQLLAHAEVCAECDELLEAQQLLFEGLEAELEDSCGDDFAAQVIAQAFPEPRWVGQRRSVAYLTLTAMAALLLFALLPRMYVRSGVVSARSKSIANADGARLLGPAWTAPRVPSQLPGAVGGATSAPQTPPTPAPGNAPSPENSRVPTPAPRARISRTEDEALHVAIGSSTPDRRTPDRPTPDRSTPEPDQANPETKRKASELPRELELLEPLLTRLPEDGVDRLAESLRPLADSFSAAFETLRRSFPLGRELRGSGSSVSALSLLGIEA